MPPLVVLEDLAAGTVTSSKAGGPPHAALIMPVNYGVLRGSGWRTGSGERQRSCPDITWELFMRGKGLDVQVRAWLVEVV